MSTPRIWIKSSYSADTANCVEISWATPSRCSGGACVQVRHDSDVVYVRDSKLGDDSPVQRWELAEWRDLLRLIKWEWTPDGVSRLADGCVEFGLERHDKLTFTGDEWKAFCKGVIAEEFEIDKLREFRSTQTAATGAVGVDAPGSTVPVAVAAPLNVPAGQHDEDPAPPLGDSSVIPIPTAGRPGLIQYEDEGSDRSRGMRCGQCGQYTGNNHQGHYWKHCSVTKQFETFHFCCPGACDLAAAWRTQYEILVERFAELGIAVDDGNAYLVPRYNERWRSLVDAARAIDNDAEAWAKATAPLVPAVETQETVS
jgi:hypothetical protein